MPHWCGSSKAPMGSGGDPFGALPDAVVQHVLGFLPARDTGRMCMLARRWRPLWRSVPAYASPMSTHWGASGVSTGS
ncbi:hypothetical protein ACP70R_042294 [Stipagrostis hirtigluma subsp. patula]